MIRIRDWRVIMMSLVMYPYIYLLARAAFLEQSVGMLDASRILGCGPWQSFLRVSMPMARPSVAVGSALVLLLRDPALQERLRQEPEKLPAFVEEVVRLADEYNSATIKPVSFPILDEVVALMKARGELEIGDLGGIRVDEHMRTSDPDIFAVGDAVEVKDFVTGEWSLVALAGPANRQGRIAADVIAGRDVRFRGCQGTAVLGAFDGTVAWTGASEKTLTRIGEDFEKAEHSIHVNQFGYKSDALGLDAAAIMMEKAREGLDVRLVVDDRRSLENRLVLVEYRWEHVIRDVDQLNCCERNLLRVRSNGGNTVSNEPNAVVEADLVIGERVRVALPSRRITNTGHLPPGVFMVKRFMWIPKRKWLLFVSHLTPLPEMPRMTLIHCQPIIGLPTT